MSQSKTIRLLMPQWQGGDYDITPPSGEIYPLGARLLAFLAPQTDAPLIEVPVAPYNMEENRPIENGVVWQNTVLQQFKVARKIIEDNKPDRIIMFGGDCLVSQAPFAYLNERYQGNVGILWIDAHPDISTPQDFNREHAMVLGNLLGKGDPVLSKEVKKPFKKDQVLIIGIDKYNAPYEEQTVKDIGLQVIPLKELTNNNEAITHWIDKNKFDHIVIHVDLDVLDPKGFYSQLTMNPNSEPFETVTGKITISQLTQILKNVDDASQVVGISFAEHMPWDALNLKNMMASMSFMK